MLDDVFDDWPDSRRGFHPLEAILSALGALAMLLSAAFRRIPSLGLRLRFASAGPRVRVAPEAEGGAEVPFSPREAVAPRSEPAAENRTPLDEKPEPAVQPPAAPPTTAELLLSRRRRRR